MNNDAIFPGVSSMSEWFVPEMDDPEYILSDETYERIRESITPEAWGRLSHEFRMQLISKMMGPLNAAPLYGPSVKGTGSRVPGNFKKRAPRKSR